MVFLELIWPLGRFAITSPYLALNAIWDLVAESAYQGRNAAMYRPTAERSVRVSCLSSYFLEAIAIPRKHQYSL